MVLHAEPLEFDLETGHAFGEIQSVSIRMEGDVGIRVGPVDPGHEYNPCRDGWPGAGGWFRWLEMSISRVEVVVTSGADVDARANSWGSMKRLYDAP